MTEAQVLNTRKWMQALMSKKYQQVAGVLKGPLDDGSIGYCCLGVGSEICDVKSTLRTKMFMFHFPEMDRSDFIPFPSAQLMFGDWLIRKPSPSGIYSPSGIDNEGHSSCILALSLMNDSGLFNFTQIAKYISEQSGVELPEVGGE